MVKATQEQINRIVDTAYAGVRLQVDVTELTDDFGFGTIKPFYPVYLEDIAAHPYNGFNDDNLAEHLDLGGDEIFTDKQRADYAFAVLQFWFEEPDADMQAVVSAAELQDSEGRKVLVAYEIKGYSFSGVEYDTIGVFTDEASIREYYRKKGYLLGIDGIKNKYDLLAYWK